MTADNFIDTNILVYAIDPDFENNRKGRVALEILEKKDIGISIQVLQEFYSVTTRKLKKVLPEEEVFALIEKYLQLPVVHNDERLLIEGIQNSIRYQTSYWDGSIIAAAERLECKVLYTEDLNDGQRYGSVMVRNPFLGDSIEG